MDLTKLMKVHSKYFKIVGVVSNVAIWRKEHTRLSCVSEYYAGINRGERNIHTTKRQHEKLKWSAYPAIKTDSYWTDKKCSYLTG
jgi:hypothetical protein